MPGELSALLDTLLAARRGHFRLESGHHGDLWLDLDGLFARPAALAPLVSELAGRLSALDVAVVCGPLTGGALLAQLVAVELDLGFCPVGRVAAGGTATYRVPDPLRAGLAGRRVAVVDDVINAGSAVRATLADLDRCGALPAALGALLVLGSPAGELAAGRDLVLAALSERDATVWPPADCPGCRSGVPLEDLLA